MNLRIKPPVTKHARERSVERFSTDLCDELIRAIRCRLTVILKKGAHQIVHWYRVDGVPVLAVWNLDPEKLITVYTDTEENRKIALQKQFKYLDDVKGNRNRMSNKFNAQKKMALLRQQELEALDDD